MLGGAIGDALGAPVEFMSYNQIVNEYGSHGIADYVEFEDGHGEFTDDTQMTLFTAEGLLRARHRAMLKGIGGATNTIVYHSYLRWLKTQRIHLSVKFPEDGYLLKQRNLYKRRAPGLTCLGALESGTAGTIDNPINDSKGCGGVMRVAPVGLMLWYNSEFAFETGCEVAAITHGHPSGFLSAGCFAAIIGAIASGENLREAIEIAVKLLEKKKNHQETLNAIKKALKLAEKEIITPADLDTLGGAWVGEEALSVALCCSMKCERDFKKGVLMAVNYSGDCDSTGAITGNILGLINGKNRIPKEWIENLQSHELVREIGEDLHTGVKGDSFNSDEAWWEKYPGY